MLLYAYRLVIFREKGKRTPLLLHCTFISLSSHSVFCIVSPVDLGSPKRLRKSGEPRRVHPLVCSYTAHPCTHTIQALLYTRHTLPTKYSSHIMTKLFSIFSNPRVRKGIPLFIHKRTLQHLLRKKSRLGHSRC